MENIIDAAIKVSDAQTGSLLLTREDETLYIAAGKGLFDQYIGTPISSSKQSISSIVFKTGKPFFIDENSMVFSSRRKERQSYFISLPIKKENNTVVGVLNLNRNDHPFGKENLPQLEAVTTNIALLLDENKLRRDRERIIVALSEITQLFSRVCCTSQMEVVFEKIFYAVKILTGIKKAGIFRYSKKRPYIVYSQSWPSHLSWKRVEGIHDLARQTLEHRELMVGEGETSKMKFLILPLTSENCPDYIFLGIMDKTIDIIEYLVLSIISNMGVSALENIILFKESRKLTQERERNRLARELHDGLAQILASTQIYLHFLEKSIVSPTQDSREILQKIKSLNTLGLEESRFILSELKGKPVSSHKFQEKAKEVVELFTIPGLSIKTDFQVHINDLPYGACKMLILILQEGLSNIQKHSQASEVRVQIANTDHSISLTIQDNGVGFDQHLLDQKGDEHFGLSNLRERVRLLRGSFLVCSHPGGGTRIEVRIPFEEREENKRVGVKRT